MEDGRDGNKSHDGRHSRPYSSNAVDYKLQEELGRDRDGSTVWSATYLPQGSTVMIKIVEGLTAAMRVSIAGAGAQHHERSLIALTSPQDSEDSPADKAGRQWEAAGLSLPLISFPTGNQLWVVFRFLNGGACARILSACFPHGLDEPLIASLGRGVLRTLKALHADGFVHGDVTAASVYLEASPPEPSSGKASTTPVASGGVRLLGSTFDSLSGTRAMLPGSKPWLFTMTPSDDMLAFGTLLMELAMGEPPSLPEAGPSEFGKKDVSEDLRNAVSRCLDPSPSERATARQLLAHPFFKKALPEEHAIPDFLATLPPLGTRNARASGAYRCCWGCGKVLEVPSASLVFKCGYCGAVTDGRTRKRQRQATWCCMFARMGHTLTVGFVLLLTLGIIASGVFVLFPLIFHEYRGALFWAHSLATAALSFNTFFNFAAAALADPGQPVSVPYGSTTVVGSRSLEDHTLCKLCEQPKPPRAHHCRVCQKCVLDMDHHCPFIGNCVGLRNQRHFLLFVGYTILSCAYVVSMCGWAATTSWEKLAPEQSKLRGYTLPRRPKQMWLDMVYGVLSFQMPWQGVYVVMLAFVSSAVVIALSVLLGLHMSYLLRGLNYIDSMQKNNCNGAASACNTSRTWFENLQNVFGTGSILRWGMPMVGQPKGSETPDSLVSNYFKEL